MPELRLKETLINTVGEIIKSFDETLEKGNNELQKEFDKIFKGNRDLSEIETHEIKKLVTGEGLNIGVNGLTLGQVNGLKSYLKESQETMSEKEKLEIAVLINSFEVDIAHYEKIIADFKIAEVKNSRSNDIDFMLLKTEIKTFTMKILERYKKHVEKIPK